MSGSEKVFLAVGAIGFLVLLFSLLFGELFELGDGPEVEIGADTDLLSPSWLNTNVLAASLVGFGAFGYVAAQTNPRFSLDWIAAAIGLVVVGAGILMLVLKPLAKQQSNSLLGRSSFVGSLGILELSIPDCGVGQVVFTDKNGARVVQSAISADGHGIPVSTPVLIVDIAKDGVIVSANPLELEE